MARYCRKCGTEVPDTGVACTQCGGVNLTNPTGTAVMEPPAAPPMAAPPPPQAYAPPQQVNTPPPGAVPPPQQQPMDWGSYVAQQLQQRVPKDQVIRSLTRAGMDAPTAMRFVNDVETAMRNAPPPPQVQAKPRPQQQSYSGGGGGLSSRSKWGLGLLILGIVLTIFSVKIWIGMIIWGIIKFFQGLGDND